jgi:hypothetical protein
LAAAIASLIAVMGLGAVSELHPRPRRGRPASP